MEVKLKKQIVGFDYLRVVACFLVVWLHVSFTNQFLSENVDFTYIAVPEFILISIFLLGNKITIRFKELIKSLFLRIAPQYFFWTFVYLFLYVMKCKLINEDVVINFDKLFLGGSAVQLWYLPALFLWQIMAYFLFKFKSNLLDLMLFIALVIFARFIIYEGYIENQFLKSFIGHTPFIVIAKNMYVNQEKLKKATLRYLLLLIIVFLTSMYVFKSINPVHSIFLYLVSVCVFILFYKIQIEPDKKIRFVSKLSFGVYLIHFGVYQVIVLLQKLIHIDNTKILITLANIISTCVISVLISSLFSKNKYLSKVI